jgi:hypothetical protein
LLPLFVNNGFDDIDVIKGKFVMIFVRNYNGTFGHDEFN